MATCTTSLKSTDLSVGVMHVAQSYIHSEQKAKLLRNAVAKVFILIQTAIQRTDFLFPKLSCTQLLKMN